ncbi:hypothetical protein BJ138DRAFT_1111447 [Hygrophoropsis aurantiaca]|uniref:Uncharacterized protein n=1 Tax=Hygrophoropsis aurantiaca TaxID=72124 RepID=A0ACB8AKG5_9AGAM|nr:hypothetical protein BJ138DRAFT_1111447 [Hygrophoropsis aurantiaca]
MTRAARSKVSVAILIALGIVTGLIGGYHLTQGFTPSFMYRKLGPDSWSHATNHQAPPHILTSYVPDEELDLDSLRGIAAKTNGFYARDYSLWLGWNNMRYIIEASLMHAQVLNRTVLIPSFVYARACEYDNAVCADYASMINKGDATSHSDWRGLPVNERMAWKIPITLMFNLTHLRHTHSVMLISEYLRLQGLSPQDESSDGQWSSSKYHTKGALGNMYPSLYEIENNKFDPTGTNRVDLLTAGMKSRGQWCPPGRHEDDCEHEGWKDSMKSPLCLSLEAVLPASKRILDWDAVRKVLQENGDHAWDISTDEGMEEVLQENGWEVLYTYEGAIGQEMVQDVAIPIRQAAPRHSLRGFHDDYAHLKAEVILLKGEVHATRKPGSMRFTTMHGREKYTNLVLHEMRTPDNVFELAAILDERMRSITGGRVWVGAHMRRGDFARLRWAMETDFRKHFERIKRHLAEGRGIVRSLHCGKPTTYNIPNVTVDMSIQQFDPPRDDDKYYIATDERNQGNLAYLREQGAVLVSDLLTMEDRRRFGWQLMLTDILGLVEQATLARGSYFYAHAMSSVAGGVMNLRAARGADPHTALLD